MKTHPRISRLLYCEPWAIRSDVHSDLCRQYEAHVAGIGMGKASMFGEDDDEEEDDLRPKLERINSQVAILPVNGIIGKRLGWLSMACGGFDLDDLTRMAGEAAADPLIQTVIVAFDTPGGTTTGMPEAAAALAGISAAGKRVIAWTDTQCCSAGMWLAAGCDEFWAAPSATVGSISTYIAALDRSKEFQAAGIEVKMFRDGDVKGIGTTGKPWTAEEEAFLTEHVARVGGEFKAWMTVRRKCRAEDMQGQWWQAQHAPAGMVDVLCNDLDTLLVDVMAPRVF